MSTTSSNTLLALWPDKGPDMKIEIKRKKKTSGLSQGIEFTQVYVNNEFIGETRNWRRNVWTANTRSHGCISAPRTRDEAIAHLLMSHMDPDAFWNAQREKDAA